MTELESLFSEQNRLAVNLCRIDRAVCCDDSRRGGQVLHQRHKAVGGLPPCPVILAVARFIGKSPDKPEQPLREWTICVPNVIAGLTN